MEKKPALVYWWILLFALCLLAYLIQINIGLHKDVAIISHTAALMLQGQTYAHDIFEPNPPLIFYLHFLPVIIAKITGINIIYVLRLYILALIVLSVTCSRALFAILFKSNTMLIDFMTFGLACILLFLPAEAFGQREHFLLILTMPYFFLVACRLDRININPFFAVLIGVMAGIGFAIKPFFLPTLLLIELLSVYRKKSLLGWIRLEAIAASLVILGYGLSVILLYPDYWRIVLPLWMPYYRGIVRPWSALLTCLDFLFCCVAMLSSCFTPKGDRNATIKTVLGLSIIGYIIAFLIPRVAWYYHLIPALSMACLYFILVFGELARESTRAIDIGVTALLAIVIFSLPVYQSMALTIRAINDFHSNNPINQLIVFFNKQQKNSTYDFLSMTHQLYALEFYSSAHYVGSFPFCSWEYTQPSLTHDEIQNQRDKLSYVLNVMRHDLDDKKPDFVIVDIPSSQAYLKRTIDFPNEYSHDKNFHHAWSHYRYFGSIKPYDMYQRIS